MRLRLVYRSYGGENRKNRPAYYSKLLTLTSFVRAAVQTPDADVIFLNDGPIPAERLAIMERYGTVVQIENGPVGMRNSYRRGLEMPDQLGWPDDDVVAYVEDDYLFTDDAFVALDEAVRGLPEASYFGLHGARPEPGDAEGRARHGLPKKWHAQPDRVVGERRWRNIASTTSTFCARVGPLRADQPIFRQCMVPFRRRFLDHETCLLYQGQVPYHGLELLTGLPGDYVPSARGAIRTLFLFPFRIALNATARRQLEPHYLYALIPNATTHLEEGVISEDQDWIAEAAKVAVWAEEQALNGASASIREVLADVD
jgi:hypothetical protein